MANGETGCAETQWVCDSDGSPIDPKQSANANVAVEENSHVTTRIKSNRRTRRLLAVVGGDRDNVYAQDRAGRLVVVNERDHLIRDRQETRTAKDADGNAI